MRWPHLAAVSVVILAIAEVPEAVEFPDGAGAVCPQRRNNLAAATACEQQVESSELASALVKASHLVSTVYARLGFPVEYRGWLFAQMLAHLDTPGPYVEIGVHRGEFSMRFLRHLRHLRNSTQGLPRYFLVDIWHYISVESSHSGKMAFGDGAQRLHLKSTFRNLARFWRQVSILQLTSREAAALFGDDVLGFVYIDARHDYCAVWEDLLLYWPKMTPGGVLAGDDYHEKVLWPRCENGTWAEGGVKQAVRAFAKQFGLPLYYFRDQWLLQKPIVLT